MNQSIKHARRPLFFLLGNHLFPPSHLKAYQGIPFFMSEDVGLCTYVRHHKQKIVLFLAAMRSYADELSERGFKLDYVRLTDADADLSYEQKLERTIKKHKCDGLVTFEIEDRLFEERIKRFADQAAVHLTFLPSPMFLTPRDEFADYLDGVNKPFMASFYRLQRRRLGVLMTDDGEPVGDRWSFDDENRKKLPKGVTIPERNWVNPTLHVEQVASVVNERFPDHAGSTDDFWLPTTRRQTLRCYSHFLDHYFTQFGDYEDALSVRDPFLFHSVLSPMLNMGLVTPKEVLDRALKSAEEHKVPLNSLEGLVRQVIGWREFIRGIDRHFGTEQEQANHWGHHRSLTPHWYSGTTGLIPLDDVIHKVNQYGWAHHIERLMVLGNLMLLCEIEPRQAYQWFMEMFVDSSDWVMGPNVYGMGLFSDGGLFATKPYICGSNYILKMSDYSRGPWCDVMDGLYWRFIGKHKDALAKNPRMSMMARAYDRLKPDHCEHILEAAEGFIERVTGPPRQ